MAGTTFKYHQTISAIGGCPAPDCAEGQRDSYRWVHATTVAEDFLPVAMEDPVRRRPIDPNDQELNCLTWGLSMFNTLVAAKSRFLQIISYYPGKKKRISGHKKVIVWLLSRWNPGTDYAPNPTRMDILRYLSMKVPTFAMT